MALNLTEAVAVTALKQNLPFSKYKTLAQWLGCYNFIPKSQRVLHPLITRYLLNRADYSNASDFFCVWLLMDMMETTLTWDQQLKVALWMNGSKPYHTHTGWNCTVAPESSSSTG